MKSLKRFLIALVSIVLAFFMSNISLVSALDLDGLETRIIAESSEWKIIKLQNFLQKLGLYWWEIDGKHASVLPSILSYQKQTGLIDSDNDWGAWYFGVKTLTSLYEDYTDLFEQYKYILAEDEPIQWDTYFYVTAYYSPLPGQSRYTTGTYAGDIRLNGWWKTTASGKWVFTGLLAWPRNYDYGTKIELEWIGVWSIEDRWWAIVNAGERGFEYDRIDIWMWYWDEWLERALKWWKRQVKWKIVSDDTDVSVAFNKSIISWYNTLYVTPESEWVDVEKLQQLFTEINLYTWNIDWKYISIKDELISFQIDNNIISSANDSQAWYFWNKTIAVLEEKYNVGDSIFITPIIKITKNFPALTRNEKSWIAILVERLNIYYKNKYWWDNIKITNEKISLIATIQSVIDNITNDDNRKQKLEYLITLL